MILTIFAAPRQLSMIMMSDERNDTALATSPGPTEEADVAEAEAECAAPVEAPLNPADEVDQLKVLPAFSVSAALPLGEKCDGTSSAMFVEFSW